MRIRGVQVSVSDQFKSIERPSDVWRVDAPRTDYMAHVSHDARNILAALVSNVDWLRTNLDSANVGSEVQSGLLDIETCCERLTGLLEDALLATRPEPLTPHIGPVSVGALVTSVLWRLQKRIQAANVRVQVAGDKDASVLIDRFLVGRLLERLLEKALEEEPAGTTLSVFYGSDGRILTLSLTRSAAGAPPQADEEVESGYQRCCLHGDNHQPPLPFCEAVLIAHGGTMIVNPSAEVGWEVRIPAAPSAAASDP